MFKFDPQKNYRMPPFFGAPDFEPDYEVHLNNVISFKFTFASDGDRLADYLPEGFKLLRPELIVKWNQLREAEFLHGHGYNMIEIDVPARFDGKKDHLIGDFPLIIWENKTRPIIGGREESGQPKIYANIEDIHVLGKKYFTTASYEGNTFMRLEMINPQPVEQDMLEKIKAGALSYNVFGWRYIPKIGAPGADLSQPVLYPQGMRVTGAWTGGGYIQLTQLSENYKYADIKKQIPDVISLYNILGHLIKLPLKASTPVMMLKGSLVFKPYSGRVLE